MKSGQEALKVVTRTLADGTRKTYSYEKKEKRPRIGRYPPGSIGALTVAYRGSPEFLRLQPATKKNYLLYLSFLERMQMTAAADIRRRNIITLRNSIAVARGPAAGNCFTMVTSVLFSWARENGYMDTSPVERIRKLEGGHYPAWTNAQAQEAIAGLPEALRRVVVLGMLTGQRRGDLIRMTWNNYDGATLRLTQAKTGMKVVIPVDAELKAELDAWVLAKVSPLILTTPGGRPWDGCYLSKELSLALQSLGLPKGLNVHGLRKLRAANLAEAGCSTHEIAAHTGHKTLSMVQLYTQSVSRERLAETAVLKMEKASRKTRENAP